MLKKSGQISLSPGRAVAEKSNAILICSSSTPASLESNWIEFPEQWDPIPLADRRVAGSLSSPAIDQAAISEAACLGYCPPTGSTNPAHDGFRAAVEPFPITREARQLLAEAGSQRLRRTGELTPIPPFLCRRGSLVNYLNAVGIPDQERVVEAAASMRLA